MIRSSEIFLSKAHEKDLSSKYTKWKISLLVTGDALNANELGR